MDEYMSHMMLKDDESSYSSSLNAIGNFTIFYKLTLNIHRLHFIGHKKYIEFIKNKVKGE